MRRGEGAALYVAVFLDLFGFGMIFPDIQLRAEAMGASGWLIGAALASTFVVQLLVSPYWGRLSDRIGRKPVLLMCGAFSAGGLLLYGPATSIPLLILSRIVSGMGGANVVIAQALIADSTGIEERTAAMGKIGAAISLGLIGGPVAGGLLAARGGLAVGLAAGSASALGLLTILLFVRSATPKDVVEVDRMLFDLSLLRESTRLRSLVLVVAIAWLSLATLEGTFGRLIKHTLGFGQAEFGIVFGYESLIAFVVQALLLAWVAKRMRDAPLLRISLGLQAIGLALWPFTYRFPVPAAWLAILLLFSTMYAVGSGLANPTINSLCSKLTPEDRQGELFGLLQSARSVGFIVGPVVGGFLFDQWFAAPYLLAGLTCLVAAVLVGRGFAQIDAS